MSDTTTAAQAGPDARPERPAPGRAGRSQLLRNAYALMLNTGISAVLGLGFWLAAARYYTESAVGQGSAAIAAMKLLAGLTAVTLTGALARFIPVAGRSTGRLIAGTYAGSSLVVALAAGAFWLTLDLWGPSYAFLAGPVGGLGFVVAVVAWNLLTLQDGVLTGLRSALWVPVGNTAFSAVKLGLLVACAATVPATGVFVSWVAAIAVSVLPLGWLVFRRLVPRHVRATGNRSAPPSPREVGRFLAGDCTGSLFSLAAVYLVPVIVAAQVGSEDNAYFYVTATIGGTVNLLAINMGASLTVEGSHAPGRLAADTRAALRRMAKIMLPVCAVLFLGAPWILGVFGAGYADAATPLLRWFAVGALLRVVIETYFAVLRAQSRTAGLAWLQGLLCALVLGLTLLLLPRMGLTGAGVAEIASLAVIVAIAAPKLYRTVRAVPPPGAVPPEEEAADGTAAGAGAREAPAGSAGRRRRPGWALDTDTLMLGVRVDVDHPERRPDVRPGPGTPPAGIPVADMPVADMPVRDAGVADPGAGAPFERDAERPVEEGGASEPVRVAREPAATPEVPPPSWRERLMPTRLGVVLGCLLIAALLLYWVPAARLGEADLDRMGGLGLVSVLPAATLAGAGLLVVVFASLLRPAREHRTLLLVTLLATVVSLHALPAVIETEPRFATAWQHLGFLDHIERTGTAVPDLDARGSWPGFFAAAAFVAQACGVDDFTEVIRWWPTLIQLAYLAPVFLLTRSLRAGWRARWAGVWIFALSGWVGQDYFSPQGFTYLLYLVFVAVLLVWFRAPRVIWTRLRPGEAEAEPVNRRQRAVLLLVVTGLFLASVPAHQLTPFVMLGVVTVLVLVGRCELRGLPLLCGVAVVSWIGFMAEPYWSGHFDELFGGIGGVGGNVSSSVSGRIEGGSSTHKLVLYTRVALAGGVLAFACWGWWRRRRAGYRERSLLVLAFVPFLGFGMQSYGGEMALRVFLFALPGAALLAALALFPRTGVTATERGRDRASLAVPATLLAGLVLMGGFLVARWGNEPFERIRSGEVAAMEYVYAHDDPSVRLLWLSNDTVENVTPAMPWGARDMEKVEYLPTLAPADPVLVSGLVKALKDAGPNAYLMVNRSQVTYLVMDAGYAPTWESRLIRNLDRRPELRTVLANDDVTMYALRERPAGEVPEPDPGPAGPRVTWTPWSVVGALAAAALLVLLAAREVVRVAARPGVRQLRALQSGFWFSLPLLAVLLASLAQRFLTLE
ncbi:lipopolysaccharide biosynthesis protein [Streptomyces sp. NPDC052687]|uniref:lipopolysaccharide biosynthesis protein n=1 Tax=Streptomyces sp. NPDC052687 TaxID=3154759 RepID=UPI003449ED50